MPSVTWYLRRFRTMSAGELVWRTTGLLRDVELCGRLALRLEPRPRADHRADTDADPEPGFRVSDVRVGEWAVPERRGDARWRDRLVAQAERIAHHRLSFFDLRDRDLGDPIDWNRDHASGTEGAAPVRARSSTTATTRSPGTPSSSGSPTGIITWWCSGAPTAPPGMSAMPRRWSSSSSRGSSSARSGAA